MTPTEQDAIVGEALREYKQKSERAAALSACIRKAAQALADVNGALDSRSDIALQTISQVALQHRKPISNAAEHLRELCKALEQKETIKADLIRMGFRDFVRFERQPG